MRNIIQYPITTQEILETLEEIKTETLERDERDQVCGNMRAAVVQEAIDRIKKHDTGKQLDALVGRFNLRG